MSEPSKSNPHGKLFTDIERFTSSINCKGLEDKGISLNEQLYVAAKRASELMEEMLPDKQVLGKHTREAFEKFLRDPSLKGLELCFSKGAINGIFKLHTLRDAELRRLLVRLSKICTEIKKIREAIARFEEYMLEIKNMR